MDDRLVRAAKVRATEEGTTLTRLIERALRLYLEPPHHHEKPFHLELLAKRGHLLPGVDLDDRDALYERMEGRDGSPWPENEPVCAHRSAGC